MFSKPLWCLLAVFFTLAAHANGDCATEERAVLSLPGVRPDFKQTFLADEIWPHDTATLKANLEHWDRSPKDGRSVKQVLYVCLLRMEVHARNSGTDQGADEPKARGRSARVM